MHGLLCQANGNSRSYFVRPLCDRQPLLRKSGVRSDHISFHLVGRRNCWVLFTVLHCLQACKGSGRVKFKSSRNFDIVIFVDRKTGGQEMGVFRPRHELYFVN